ncbi:hypothetical protein EYC59_02630 [Candidatus Saccharibacteria bacterium]|nr:MAG: hypothetical protein EYC59_02630 [Candidatus Saccharibacteria bacterium]
MTGETPAPAPAEQHKTPAVFAQKLHAKLSKKLLGVKFKAPSYSTTIWWGEDRSATVSDDNSYMLVKRSLRTSPEQRYQDIKAGNAILSLMDTDAANESNRFLILKPHSVRTDTTLGYYISAHPEILGTTGPDDYAILQVEKGKVTEPYTPFIHDVAAALGISAQ